MARTKFTPSRNEITRKSSIADLLRRKDRMNFKTHDIHWFSHTRGKVIIYKLQMPYVNGCLQSWYVRIEFTVDMDCNQKVFLVFGINGTLTFDWTQRQQWSVLSNLVRCCSVLTAQCSMHQWRMDLSWRCNQTMVAWRGGKWWLTTLWRPMNEKLSVSRLLPPYLLVNLTRCHGVDGERKSSGEWS